MSQRRAAVALLVLVGAVVPAVVTAAGGGFGVTRNDDSAFVGSARAFADHGVFVLRGPADMTLFGQTVLAWPVAKATDGVAGLQFATLAMAVVGLLSVLYLARQVVDLRRAVLVSVVVAATPIWIPLATSFMTDVWSFALGALALALVAWAASRESTGRFLGGVAAALVAGSWAFMVRQTTVAVLFALAVGVAVSLVTVRANRPGRTVERAGAAGLLGVAAVICAVLYRWRSSLPIGTASPPGLTFDQVTLPLQEADRVLLTLALLLLPASVLFLRRGLVVRRARARPRLALVLGAVIGSITFVKLLTQPIHGLTLYDYSSRFGASAFSGPQVVIPIVPWAPWAVLLGVAAVNLWALVLVATGPWLRRCWAANPVVLAVAGSFLVSSSALFLVGWATAGRTFDRYLLPAVPVLALMLAWIADVDRPDRPEPPAPPEPVADAGVGKAAPLGRLRPALFGLLVVVAAWFGLASASFDRATVDAGMAAVARYDLASSEIDGGMTWRERQLDADLAPTASFRPPQPRGQCIEVRQTSDRSKVVGRPLLHERVLWVDRWFYAVARPRDC